MTTKVHEFHVSVVETPLDDYLGSRTPACDRLEAIRRSAEWLIERMRENLHSGTACSLVFGEKVSTPDAA